MTVFFLHTWILRSVILCSLTGLSSFENNDSNDNQLSSRYSSGLSDTTKNYNKNRIDTVAVLTTEELIQHIGSNKVIELISPEYVLRSTLLIDSIKNLKIIGTGLSKLMIDKRNTTVLKLSNSQNIYLDKFNYCRWR